MSELTEKDRAKLPSKEFGLPEKARTAEAKKQTGNYPMPDRNHAISAKSREPDEGRIRPDQPQGRQGPRRGRHLRLTGHRDRLTLPNSRPTSDYVPKDW